MLLEGKRVVVVGAGSGIGRSVAVAASQAGAGVVLAGRTEEALEATQGDLAEAAKRLNLSTATLQRKMKKLGLTTGG